MQLFITTATCRDITVFLFLTILTTNWQWSNFSLPSFPFSDVSHSWRHTGFISIIQNSVAPKAYADIKISSFIAMCNLFCCTSLVSAFIVAASPSTESWIWVYSIPCSESMLFLWKPYMAECAAYRYALTLHFAARVLLHRLGEWRWQIVVVVMIVVVRRLQ